MKTLKWRHTGWTHNNFIFWDNAKPIGKLSFNNSWNFNAIYISDQEQIKFIERGIFNENVVVMKNSKKVGHIKNKTFGHSVLKLNSGGIYRLTSNFWGTKSKWLNQKGEPVIGYDQASLSSMGKGSINLTGSLDDEVIDILTSGGIYVQQVSMKKIMLMMIIFLPMWITMSS